MEHTCHKKVLRQIETTAPRWQPPSLPLFILDPGALETALFLVVFLEPQQTLSNPFIKLC